MALAVHAGSLQYSTPTFSRDSTGSSFSALNSSAQTAQTAASTLETPHSAYSTPAETPPPSRGHHHHMSYSLGAYGPPNGIHLKQNGVRPLGDVNGFVPQQQIPPGYNPQIYTVRLCSNSACNPSVTTHKCPVQYVLRFSNGWAFCRPSTRVSKFTRWK